MTHATRTLHVSVTIGEDPEVTVVEGNQEFGKHKYTIEWVPEHGQTGWSFEKITKGDKETPLDASPSPFTIDSITADKITVTDDNKHHTDHGTYQYQICVTTADGKEHWSDPEIINKGGTP